MADFWDIRTVLIDLAHPTLRYIFKPIHLIGARNDSTSSNASNELLPHQHPLFGYGMVYLEEWFTAFVLDAIFEINNTSRCVIIVIMIINVYYD